MADRAALIKQIEELQELAKGIIGNAGAKASGAPAMAAPKAAPAPAMAVKKAGEHCAYDAKMQKRAADLVKSGLPPGEAVKKAREEHGVDADAKMKVPASGGMKLHITKNDGAGMTPSGDGGAGGAPF